MLCDACRCCSMKCGSLCGSLAWNVQAFEVQRLKLGDFSSAPLHSTHTPCDTFRGNESFICSLQRFGDARPGPCSKRSLASRRQAEGLRLRLTYAAAMHYVLSARKLLPFGCNRHVRCCRCVPQLLAFSLVPLFSPTLREISNLEASRDKAFLKALNPETLKTLNTCRPKPYVQP